MPKYGGKQIFSLGSFPEWVKSNRRREKNKNKKERRVKVSDYNDQYLSPEPKEKKSVISI